MSNWSIVERSVQRVVTQQDLRSKLHPVKQLLIPLIVSVPGLLAIWFGVPLLPKPIDCQPSGSGAECAGVTSSLDLPLQATTTPSPQTLLKPTTIELEGHANLVWLGIGYLGGIATIALIFALTVTTKEVWTFDRNGKIDRQRHTRLRNQSTQFDRSQIFDLIVEIPNLSIDNTIPVITGKINLVENRITTQPIATLFGNSQEPNIYYDKYDRLEQIFSEAIDPIGQILDLPWQLKFFFYNDCYIFNFDRQCIEGFTEQGELIIPFSVVRSFEIETISLDMMSIPLSEHSIGGNIDRQGIHRLLVMTENDGCFPIHEAESKDSRGKSETGKDSRSYRWLEQLQSHLTRLAIAPVVVK